MSVCRFFLEQQAQGRGNRKLNAEIVAEIRTFLSVVGNTQRKAADQFKISRSTVHQIASGQTWRLR